VKEYDFDHLYISICRINIKISFTAKENSKIFFEAELTDQAFDQLHAMKTIVFFFQKALNSSIPLLDIIQVRLDVL
jgi:hypothetical protein